MLFEKNVWERRWWLRQYLRREKIWIKVSQREKNEIAKIKIRRGTNILRLCLLKFELRERKKIWILKSECEHFFGDRWAKHSISIFGSKKFCCPHLRILGGPWQAFPQTRLPKDPWRIFLLQRIKLTWELVWTNNKWKKNARPIPKFYSINRRFSKLYSKRWNDLFCFFNGSHFTLIHGLDPSWKIASAN